MIERRGLTSLLVTTIAGIIDMPVGMAHAPRGGGWEGQPNADGSNFVPYTVVNPQTATMASGPISEPQTDRQIPYSLTSFGVAPEQTEWIADKARAAAETLKKTVIELADRDYRVQQVRTDVIGGLIRVDQTEPAYWGQTDVITLWITPN